MNVFFDISIEGRPVGRLEFELFDKEVPKTAENFRVLCEGSRESANGTRLQYKRSRFHRLIPGFMIQGGDFTNHDGSGGLSIYGPSFEDESFKRKHDKRGLLSMANAGPNTNGSQFFLTFAPTPHLDGKHVVFGQVNAGHTILKELEHVPTGGRDVPSKKVEITDCGVLTSATSNPGLDNSVSSNRAVNEKLSKFRAKQKRKDKAVEEKVVSLNFPIPTDSNPSAMFRDNEGIIKAQKKADEATTSMDKNAAYATMNPRKIKLIELRKKMARSRQSNQKEVLQEHQRFLDKGLVRRQRQEEWEQLESESLEELQAKGGSAKDAYLVETAERAVALAEKKRKKAIRSAKAMDRSGLYNQEAAYQAYKKRVLNAPDPAVVVSTKDQVSREGKTEPELIDRMVAELESTDKRKQMNKLKSKGKDVEGKDVDGINKSNDAWNKRLSRAFDKYTVEIKQNLERGTAL